MDTALQVGLTNIAVAAVITLLAAGASLIRSRPALAHALWLLVILKLLTPPLWGVHVDSRWARALQPTLEQPAVEQSHQATAQGPAAPRSPIAQFTPQIESAASMPDASEAEF